MGERCGGCLLKRWRSGPSFVFVGRLWVWGLSIMGEHGVRHVTKGLLGDFDILMNVAGCQSINQINRDWLESGSLIPEKSKL